MSIPIGKGFQPNDGVSIFCQPNGSDTNDGTTSEKPVLTVADGVAKAAALISFPFIPLATVKVTSGIYSEALTVPNSVYISGMAMTLTNDVDSETTLSAGSSQFNRVGFLGASGDNSTVYETDGVIRSSIEGDTFSLGSFFAVTTGITGLSIKGVTDDNNFRFVNGACRSTNGKLIDFAGESDTPVTIDIGTFTNNADGFIGLDCNSTDANQIVNLKFNNFTNVPDTVAKAAINSIADSTLLATNVTFCTGTSGRVNLIGGNINMPSEMAVVVKNGLLVDVNVSQIAGDIECQSGGFISFSRLGLHLGDLLIKDGGAVSFAYIGDITGDVTIEANAAFDGLIEKIISDVTIGANAVFHGTIGTVGGTVTVDPSASVDGIIDGVAYGNAIQSSDIVSLGSFGVNDVQFPSSNPAAANSRNGHAVINYDDTTTEQVIYSGVMSNDYSDGDFTVYVEWVSEDQTSGNATFGVSFERVTGTDIDSDSFATERTGTDACNATNGITTVSEITFTQAQADSMAAGESFRIKVRRGGLTGDTMTNDAQVLNVSWAQ